MNTFTISHLKDYPQHASTCAAWSFGEWGCHYKNGSLNRTVERYKQASTENHKDLPQTWVGRVDDKIVGMISLTAEDHPDCKDLTPWLASFFVHPYYRGRGYGHALIEHLEKEAHGMGHSTLYLYTPSAQNLYKKHSWEIISQKYDPTGLYDHVEVMRKDLTRS